MSATFETLRTLARSLRRAVADAEGRIPDATLTDGVELLLDTPIRVVFADAALSGPLFEGAAAEELAFSAPHGDHARTPLSGSEPPAGGYVCLRAGVLDRLAAGDPAARFALAHELGHRVAGHGVTTRFSERATQDPKLFATPGFRRGGLSDAQLATAIGGDNPAGPVTARTVGGRLAQDAAANLFAFCFLTEPETFSPSAERLDRWAAHYGAPFAAALAYQRRTPALYQGGALGSAPFLGMRAAMLRRRPASA